MLFIDGPVKIGPMNNGPVVVIGLGTMGRPIALTLARAGFDVVGSDVSPAALREFSSAGGREVPLERIPVAEARAVVTVLPEGRDVREVYESAVFGAARPGTLLIDCSTIDVSTTAALAAEASGHGLEMVDAPVSGGPEGAASGSLSFMVGGSEDGVERATPYLEAAGSKVMWFGPSGSGQAAKACHNMIVGITGLAVFEGFALAEALGLDAARFHELCSGAAAACWTLEHRCPVPGVVADAPSSNGYEPGFAAALMAKDLRLAQQAAGSVGCATELGALAAERFAAFVERHGGSRDYSAIYQVMRPGAGP